MKEKILPFIIGVLVGAIIATAGFAIYTNVNKNNHKGFRDGTPPQMMQNGNSDNRGTPPDRPDGQSNSQNNSNSQENSSESSQTQTPPELPSNNDSTTSQSQS